MCFWASTNGYPIVVSIGTFHFSDCFSEVFIGYKALSWSLYFLNLPGQNVVLLHCVREDIGCLNSQKQQILIFVKWRHVQSRNIRPSSASL